MFQLENTLDSGHKIEGFLSYRIVHRFRYVLVFGHKFGSPRFSKTLLTDFDRFAERHAHRIGQIEAHPFGISNRLHCCLTSRINNQTVKNIDIDVIHADLKLDYTIGKSVLSRLKSILLRFIKSLLFSFKNGLTSLTLEIER